MSSYYWIKLFHEILEDPKMATLPDRLWRRTIELFLLAGKFGKDGELPETKQLAWVLRIPTDELDLDLKQIEGIGIVKRTKTGWIVTNFSKRQAAIPAKDRMSQMREQRRKQEYYTEVTEQLRDVTQSKNQIKEVDIDKEVEVPTPFQKLLYAYWSAVDKPLRNPGKRDVEALNRMVAGGVTADNITTGVMELISKDYHIVGPASVENAAFFARDRKTKVPHEAIAAEEY
jgi:hypothetical protein